MEVTSSKCCIANCESEIPETVSEQEWEYCRICFALLENPPTLISKSLCVLDLSHNAITTVTALSTLTHLHTLRIGDNRINDLSPLKALVLVEEFWFQNNDLENFDDNVGSALKYMDVLTHVVAYGNPFSTKNENNVTTTRKIRQNFLISSKQLKTIDGKPLNEDEKNTLRMRLGRNMMKQKRRKAKVNNHSAKVKKIVSNNVYNSQAQSMVLIKENYESRRQQAPKKIAIAEDKTILEPKNHADTAENIVLPNNGQHKKPSMKTKALTRQKLVTNVPKEGQRKKKSRTDSKKKYISRKRLSITDAVNLPDFSKLFQ